MKRENMQGTIPPPLPRGSMKMRLRDLFGQARVLPALLRSGSVVGSLALAALLSSPCAAAREYRISVDGQPVRFDGIGPVQVSGRVLVPLRGVLERIGATVEWSASSKTVAAQRGPVRLDLPVGQRSAVVNGRSVTLDVPAMIMRGTVMVPLRFVSEALGVSVRESGGQIQISTGATRVLPSPQKTTVADRPRVSPPAGVTTAPPVLAPAVETRQPSKAPAPQPTPTGDGVVSSQTVAGTVDAVNTEGSPQTITILSDDRSVEYALAAGAVVLSRAGNRSQESSLKEVYPGDRVLGKRDAVSGRITILVVQYDQVEGDVRSVDTDLLSLTEGEPVMLTGSTPVVLPDGTRGTSEDLRVGDYVRVRMRPDTRIATVITVTRAATPAAEAPQPQTAAALAPTTEETPPAVTEAEAPTRVTTPGATTVEGTTAAEPATPVAEKDESPTVETPPAAEAAAVEPKLTVTSFTHDARASLRAGSVLTVTLEGDEGATATFSVGDLGQDLAMQEMAPGKYVGTFSIPEGVNSRFSVFGKLTREGKESPLVQAGVPVVIDSVPPVVSDVEPAREALVEDPQPMIYVVFEDAEGSGVVPEQVKLIVAGEDVTTQATRTPRFITYRPILPFANGPVTARVLLSDRAGNTAETEWQFTINAPEVPITSVAHNATRPVSLGQSFTVTMAGKPRGTATFSIGTMKAGIPMTETTPGIYQGRYTAEKGDVAFAARIIAQLVTETGEQFTRECSEPITILTVAPRAPSITSPSEDEVVEGPVTVHGKAQPGVTVRVQVVRKTRTLGLWSDRDVIAAQEVKVDSDGGFVTGKLQVPRPRRDGETVTIQAVAIDPVGHRSEVASVKVKLQ